MAAEIPKPPNEPSMSNAPREQDEHARDLQTLLFERSPWETVDAIVQHDSRTVYFYLNGAEPFGTRACWVRNLQPAPWVQDDPPMPSDRPPLMPKTCCASSATCDLPKEDDLNVIWFEEGNGAALLEGSELLAIIPPWSGTEGFHGYARDCIGESRLAWPLPNHPQLQRRLARAAQFWLSFRDPQTDPFRALQQQQLTVYDSLLGGGIEGHYFAIDGAKFPPRGLSVYEREDAVIGVTVAMALCPQPNVELAVESPAAFRRIELGIRLPTGLSESIYLQVWEALSGLAAYPWRQFQWLGTGHTVDFPVLKKVWDEEIDRAALIASDTSEWPVELPSFREDPVRLLWLQPLGKEN